MKRQSSTSPACVLRKGLRCGWVAGGVTWDHLRSSAEGQSEVGGSNHMDWGRGRGRICFESCSQLRGFTVTTTPTVGTDHGSQI